MDRQRFQDWLDRYVAAWKSYDEGDIRALFSEEATYQYHPQDEPERGRDAIVAAWLHEPDEKDTYDAEYRVLAIDGDVHVAEGWSRYYENGALSDEFCNIYVCRFNEAGECTEFIEYWIQNRDFRKRYEEKMKAQAAVT